MSVLEHKSSVLAEWMDILTVIISDVMAELYRQMLSSIVKVV